jgi:hypothetical protein
METARYHVVGNYIHKQEIRRERQSEREREREVVVYVTTHSTHIPLDHYSPKERTKIVGLA